MEQGILNVIWIIFPILMYLVFSCYNVLNNRRMSRLIFIITMATSLYFSLKITALVDNKNLLLLFCNIPIVISYYKREGLFGLLLSFIVVLVSYYGYDMNIYVSIFKYILYFLVYLLLYKRKNFDYLFLKLVALIQGFFISFEYFMITGNSFDKIFILIMYAGFIYMLTFFCIYLFSLADNISSMYSVVSKAKRDSMLRDSLFKLTHEIKNPIAVCKGYLDMMDLSDSVKSKRYVEVIKSEIDRSLNVITDFMEYSKIKVDKELFDMSMLLNEVYDSWLMLAGSREIKFQYHNEYEDLYLLGDYQRLKQVFVNLIKNSIESISGSGIIKMDVFVVDGFVKVVIEDNGIGMDKTELDNMKEMFYTTKKCGTGLGVALSDEIILAHNGELNYTSKKNVGTICTVSLPI